MNNRNSRSKAYSRESLPDVKSADVGRFHFMKVTNPKISKSMSELRRYRIVREEVRHEQESSQITYKNNHRDFFNSCTWAIGTQWIQTNYRGFSKQPYAARSPLRVHI